MEKIPELKNFQTPGTAHWEEVKPYYEEYVSELSVDHMAISPELAVFLTALCHALKPKRILDLGSGFSSFIFRRYGLNAPVKPKIDSIDDSEEWLDKTRAFLSRHHLPTGHMQTWESFLRENQGTFDFILHDLGSMEVRKGMLQKVLALASPGGVVILDDVHKKSYQSHAKKLLKESDLQYYTLELFTKDKFGRYAMLVTV